MTDLCFIVLQSEILLESLKQGKVHPRTDHERLEAEWRCSSTLYFNLGTVGAN